MTGRTIQARTWAQVRDTVALWPWLSEGDGVTYLLAPGLDSRRAGLESAVSDVVMDPATALQQVGPPGLLWQSACLRGEVAEGVEGDIAAYLFALQENQTNELSCKPAELLALAPTEAADLLVSRLHLDLKHLVVWSGHPDWLLPAVFYAVTRRLALVALSDIQALKMLVRQTRCRTLTIVAPPEYLDNRVLQSIQRAGMRDGLTWELQEVSLGLLTGRTPATALDIAARSAIYLRMSGESAHEDMLVIMADTNYDNFKGTETPGELVLLPRDTTYAEIVPRLLEGSPLRSLNLMAHGREDVIWLADTLVCGSALHERGMSGETGRLPACAYDGQCYRPERKLLNAADIHAQVVFLNSCLALKLAKSNFSPNYSVALRFLDGWPAACVASAFSVDGRFFQNLLFHRLFRSGETVGEAVRAVNNATLTQGLDFPGLAVLGDASLRLAYAGQEIPELSWSQEQAVLKIPASVGCTLRVVVPNAARKALNAQLFFQVEGPVGHKVPLYQVLVPEPRTGDAHIYLLSLAPFPDGLELRWTTEDPLESVGHLHEEFHQLYTSMESMGIRLQLVERLVPQVRDTARGLSGVAYDYRYHVQSTRSLNEKTKRLERLCQQSREILLDWLLDTTQRKNYHFSEEYRRTYRLKGTAWSQRTCPYCEDPLYTMVATNNLWGARRKLDICPTCGVTQDIPAGSPIRACFGGEPCVPRGEVRELRLVIKNEGARPIKLLTGLCVVQGQTYGFSVQPDRVTLELAQGTQTEIPFTLQAHPTVRPHQYWLCGYILAHGGVQMVSRSFWVTVKGGH